MEDCDRIEIAYILETDPSFETYERLFKSFLIAQGRDPSAEEIRITYWDEDEKRNEKVGKYKEIAQILPAYPTVSAELQTSWDELSIGFSKQGMGLLSYQLTPYIDFSTWIYALKDVDDEKYLEEEIKPDRREFAELHAAAANALDPKWGFGQRCGLAVGENETVEELAARVRPPLYEYNVFREETVEAIGREQVLSAPAYYVEELDSGGVFMAVTEPPRQWGHEDQPFEAVADHLALPTMTPERYH